MEQREMFGPKVAHGVCRRYLSYIRVFILNTYGKANLVRWGDCSPEGKFACLNSFSAGIKNFPIEARSLTDVSHYGEEAPLAWDQTPAVWTFVWT